MGPRVLVVDDDDALRHTLDRTLSVAGFSVAVAPDGNHALRALDVEVFDLLIIDIYMPDLDGIGLLRELRRRKDQTPVLVVSGGGESPHALDPEGALAVARAFGATVLAKPFGIDELLDAVAVALDTGNDRQPL